MKLLGRIRNPNVRISLTLPWKVPAKSSMQGAFFCRFRQGFGSECPAIWVLTWVSSKKLSVRKHWDDFSFPIGEVHKHALAGQVNP